MEELSNSISLDQTQQSITPLLITKPNMEMTWHHIQCNYLSQIRLLKLQEDLICSQMNKL